jgi:hypothetical protein
LLVESLLALGLTLLALPLPFFALSLFLSLWLSLLPSLSLSLSLFCSFLLSLFQSVSLLLSRSLPLSLFPSLFLNPTIPLLPLLLYFPIVPLLVRLLPDSLSFLRSFDIVVWMLSLLLMFLALLSDILHFGRFRFIMAIFFEVTPLPDPQIIDNFWLVLLLLWFCLQFLFGLFDFLTIRHFFAFILWRKKSRFLSWGPDRFKCFPKILMRMFDIFFLLFWLWRFFNNRLGVALAHRQ